VGPTAKVVTAVVVLGVLPGCGGGGGSDTSPTSTYTVSGSVSGLAAGAQVRLLNNGGDGVNITANGSFAFPTPIPHNSNYAVTVGNQPTGQTCTVTNGTGTRVNSNITNVVVGCAANAHTVGGSLSGLQNGTQVTVLNNGGDALTLSANGPFVFTAAIARNGTYAVTVSSQPAGRICTVTNATGAGVTANVTNVLITCSATTYTIGGSLSGLAGGAQVTLLNNSSDPLPLSADGAFQFSTRVAHDGSYAVTVGTQPAGQSCRVTNGTGSSVTSNVSNITVACGACATTLTGVLATSTTYPLANSPYCIGNFQIPGGITATFEPGTSIAGGTITVQGRLAINGTGASKVSITNTAIVPAGLTTSLHSIDIAHANISGGTIYAPTGNAIYGSLNIADSTISNLQSYMYFWYPLGTNTIARNVFLGSGGISYGIDFRDPQVVSVSIVNKTGGYALENWAQYGSGSVLVRDNTFATTSLVAVRLTPQHTDAAMNAVQNYWGTTDSATIPSMIYDKNDDITTAGNINFVPFLTAPAPGTPVP
jgi:hypothetical protein